MINCVFFSREPFRLYSLHIGFNLLVLGVIHSQVDFCGSCGLLSQIFVRFGVPQKFIIFIADLQLLLYIYKTGNCAKLFFVSLSQDNF